MVESTMDYTTVTNPQSQSQSLTKKSNKNKKRFNRVGEDDYDGDAEECDVEVWETLSKGFRQVQSVLDRNCALIQQVNENHQSRIPVNLTKNVALIREINGNISKVLSIYSDLSVNFSNIVHQRRPIMNGTGGESTKN